MPQPVVREMGVALRAAQGGRKAPGVKPYTTDDHKGSSVLEVVEDFDTDTYRLVYTVHFPDVVFVLYGFQKKSKTGRETPKLDKAMIERRYNVAKELAKDPPEELAKLMEKYRAEVAAAAPPRGSKRASGRHPTKSKKRK